MDQRDKQRSDAPPVPDDRVQQQQFQQQKGRQDDVLAHGQSSASEAGLEADDLMSQADRGSTYSTSAQRSGSQARNGQGNEGSSLGGRTSSRDAASAMFDRKPLADGTGDPAKPSDLDGE